MSTSSNIQLVIEDFGNDASAVTRMVGLEPTGVGMAETAMDFGPLQKASWFFEISMPETESIEGQALALLRFLESHAEALRQAATRYPASIAIAFTAPGHSPSNDLSLVPLVAADISKLGLGIRIYFSSGRPNGAF